MSIFKEFLIPSNQTEPSVMRLMLEMDSKFIKMFLYKNRRAEKPTEIEFFGHGKKMNNDLKRDITMFLESHTDDFNAHKITKIISENIKKA